MNRDFNNRVQNYLADKQSVPAAGPIRSQAYEAPLDFSAKPTRKPVKRHRGRKITIFAFLVFAGVVGLASYALNEARHGRLELSASGAIEAVNALFGQKFYDAYELMPKPPAGWARITQGDMRTANDDPNAIQSAIITQVPDWEQGFASNESLMDSIIGLGVLAKEAETPSPRNSPIQFGTVIYAGGDRSEIVTMQLRMGIHYDRFGKEGEKDSWAPAFIARAKKPIGDDKHYRAFEFGGYPAVISMEWLVENVNKLEDPTLEFSVLLNHRTELRIKGNADPEILRQIIAQIDLEQIEAQLKRIGLTGGFSIQEHVKDGLTYGR